MPTINLIAIATPAFLVMVGVEMAAAYAMRREIYEVKDTATSLLMGVGSTVVGGVVGFTFFALAAVLAPFRLLHIEWSILAVALCFLAEDFSYYWYHRAGHKIRWMWVDHVNHHSSQHYNLSTALRQSWNGFLTPGILFKAPMIVIGFPLEMMAIVHSTLLIYQFAIHTQYVKRLPGWIEFLFNTPSHHRVHHARNPQYLDSNFGGILIVWDRLFGTFVRESDDTRIEYGLVENIATFNLLRVSYHGWIGLWTDLRTARDLRSVAGFLFAPPGWRPTGEEHTSKAIRSRWLAAGGARQDGSQTQDEPGRAPPAERLPAE